MISVGFLPRCLLSNFYGLVIDQNMSKKRKNADGDASHKLGVDQI